MLITSDRPASPILSLIKSKRSGRDQETWRRPSDRAAFFFFFSFPSFLFHKQGETRSIYSWKQSTQVRLTPINMQISDNSGGRGGLGHCLCACLHVCVCVSLSLHRSDPIQVCQKKKKIEAEKCVIAYI